MWWNNWNPDECVEWHQEQVKDAIYVADALPGAWTRRRRSALVVLLLLAATYVGILSSARADAARAVRVTPAATTSTLPNPSTPRLVLQEEPPYELWGEWQEWYYAQMAYDAERMQPADQRDTVD
jgi:hypothetical protein